MLRRLRGGRRVRQQHHAVRAPGRRPRAASPRPAAAGTPAGRTPGRSAASPPDSTARPRDPGGRGTDGPDPRRLQGYRPDSCRNTLQGLSSGPRVAPEPACAAGRRSTAGRAPATASGSRTTPACRPPGAPAHPRHERTAFATQTIPATVHEAPYILDGLLMNETGRRVREQYADTGGFTDHVFAACSILGYAFVPRNPGPALEAPLRVRTRGRPGAPAPAGRRQGERGPWT